MVERILDQVPDQVDTSSNGSTPDNHVLGVEELVVLSPEAIDDTNGSNGSLSSTEQQVIESTYLPNGNTPSAPLAPKPRYGYVEPGTLKHGPANSNNYVPRYAEDGQTKIKFITEAENVARRKAEIGYIDLGDDVFGMAHNQVGRASTGERLSDTDIFQPVTEPIDPPGAIIKPRPAIFEKLSPREKIRHIRQELKEAKQQRKENELTPDEQKEVYGQSAVHIATLRDQTIQHAEDVSSYTHPTIPLLNRDMPLVPIIPFTTSHGVKSWNKFRHAKKDATRALLQLDEITDMEGFQQEIYLDHFGKTWGDDSAAFEQLHVQTQDMRESKLKLSPDEQSDGAGAVLRDLNIPVEEKIKLLMDAGHTPEKALKIGLGLGAAAGLTLAYKTVAEHGGFVAQGIEGKYDFGGGLSFQEKVGVAAASWAGFYGMTALYVKRSIDWVKKTGYSTNAWVSGAYHGTPFMAEKLRQKAIFMAGVMPDLAFDAIYGIPALLDRNPLLFAAANVFGIVFTAGQTAIQEGALKTVELVENHAEQKELKENTIVPVEGELIDATSSAD